MISPARTPHLFALGGAMAILGVLLVVGQISVGHLEQRSIHRVTPRVNLELTRRAALQAAALAQRDLLPVYGSSELAMPVPNRPTLFFRDYPSGFEVYPVGQAGTYPLIMLQKLAAVAPQLRGRKVVISLSSGWFRHKQMGTEAFGGNFSPLDSFAFIFGSGLSMKLKRDVARRLESVGTPISKWPVAVFALHQLADSSRLARAGFWLACPLGKLQTAILRLQDHFEACRFLAGQPAHSGNVHRIPEALDWPALIATAAEQVGDTPGDETDPAAFTTEAQRLDRVFIEHVETSALWPDLKMLLRTLRELGAEPLILSTPFNGPYQNGMHVSRSARQLYYDRFNRMVRRFGFACRDFEEHDEDKRFVADQYDHLSGKGWMIYDQVLDDFFHDRAVSSGPGIGLLTQRRKDAKSW
ncbi:MAG: D-alanine transfer protein [Chthoniobacter sp.]|jgi:D-alanine transfer protein|nr:D-alanine transfer protein [Chthoniobacter sp.]